MTSVATHTQQCMNISFLKVMIVSTLADQLPILIFLENSIIPPCKFPGCYKKRFVDPITGNVRDFCNKSHALQYKSML